MSTGTALSLAELDVALRAARTAIDAALAQIAVQEGGGQDAGNAGEPGLGGDAGADLA